MYHSVRATITIAVALLSPVSLSGQTGATTLSGVVIDSAGLPIAGAHVSIAATSSATVTNERGEFRLSTAASVDRLLELRVRRLGFSAESLPLRVGSGESLKNLQIRLAALPVSLTPVVVHSNQTDPRDRLAGYYQRLQRRAGGHFIPRTEIDRKSYLPVPQLLRRIPGITVIPFGTGGGSVRMRGRSCRPLVWIDGIPMPAADVDLGAFPATTLHGIEVYLGPVMTPAEFKMQGGPSNCGTVLLWSRGPDTDPPAARRGAVVDLDALVRSLAIYSADQVDKQAELNAPESLIIAYPTELIPSGIGGTVLVEFVVDTTGRIERDTYAIVSSSHPLFSAAVTNALRSAKYTAAIKDGQKVRQAVQQPFRFSPAPQASAARP